MRFVFGYPKYASRYQAYYLHPIIRVSTSGVWKPSISDALFAKPEEVLSYQSAGDIAQYISCSGEEVIHRYRVPTMPRPACASY